MFVFLNRLLIRGTIVSRSNAYVSIMYDGGCWLFAVMLAAMKVSREPPVSLIDEGDDQKAKNAIDIVPTRDQPKVHKKKRTVKHIVKHWKREKGTGTGTGTDNSHISYLPSRDPRSDTSPIFDYFLLTYPFLSSNSSSRK